MDPNANIEEQRSLAREVIRTEEGDSVNGLRLAELVLALDEWRTKGGFDPYGATPSLSSSVVCPDCGAEVDVRSARAL